MNNSTTISRTSAAQSRGYRIQALRLLASFRQFSRRNIKASTAVLAVCSALLWMAQAQGDTAMAAASAVLATAALAAILAPLALDGGRKEDTL